MTGGVEGVGPDVRVAAGISGTASSVKRPVVGVGLNARVGVGTFRVIGVPGVAVTVAATDTVGEGSRSNVALGSAPVHALAKAPTIATRQLVTNCFATNISLAW